MNLASVLRRDAPPPPPPLNTRPLFEPHYRALVKGETLADILPRACRDLAAALHLPLVLLMQRHASGTLEIEASSDETLLWAELLRMPERWNGSVCGDGAAARSLREGVPVLLPYSDDGAAPWRRAAEKDGITAVLAWPVEDLDPPRVLCLYGRPGDALGSEVLRNQAREAASEFQSLLHHARRMSEDALVAAALRHSASAALITGTDGTIVWTNAAFSRLCGYTPGEVLGRNPSFLKSGEQSPEYYRRLWLTLRSGLSWRGEVVDRHHDGHHYGVRQTVTPFGAGERVTHYLALQEPLDAPEGHLAAASLDPVRPAQRQLPLT